MGVTTDTDVLSISDRQRETERDERIRQLEQLNATLAAEVDRMRPVVEAAVAVRHGEASEFRLNNAICDYEMSKSK